MKAPKDKTLKVGILVGIATVLLSYVHFNAGVVVFAVGCGLGGLYLVKTQPESNKEWLQSSLAVFTVAVFAAIICGLPRFLYHMFF